MRIAIVGSRGYPSTYGGFETLVRKLTPYLRDQGHSVSVYCRAGLRWRSRVVGGIRCIDTPCVDTKRLSTLSAGLTAMIDACFRQYDVVLVLNVANGYFLRMLSAVGTPTVVNVDGIEWERGKWGRFARYVFHRGAKRTADTATSLIADSRTIASYWLTTYSRKSHYIPYGADIVMPTPRGIEHLGLESQKYMLVVARLVPENNIDLILDACEILETTSHTAVIVGDSNYESALRARVCDLAQKNRILALGHVDDQMLLHELWAHAGVYVHGHSVGGTNPALLQAMGAGAPTLAFDTPYNLEVLNASNNLFDDDASKLAAKVRNILADADLQNRMRYDGRRIIIDRFSWQAVLQQYESALIAASATNRVVDRW